MGTVIVNAEDYQKLCERASKLELKVKWLEGYLTALQESEQRVGEAWKKDGIYI